MKVVEIFDSFQGEGVDIGRPACFVRLAGCNLRCVWCDSKYTWDESIEMMVEDVYNKIKESPYDLIVITGGEPLVQQLELVKLVELLVKRAPWKILTVETNGTIEPHFYLQHHVQLWSVSPKLSNSGMKAYLNRHVLKLLWELPSQFKFVVGNKEDVEEAAALVEELKLTHRPIVFQPDNSQFVGPKGFDVEGYLELMRKLNEALKETQLSRLYDVRLLPQLHVLLYGVRRGV